MIFDHENSTFHAPEFGTSNAPAATMDVVGASVVAAWLKFLGTALSFTSPLSLP